MEKARDEETQKRVQTLAAKLQAEQKDLAEVTEAPASPRPTDHASGDMRAESGRS